MNEAAIVTLASARVAGEVYQVERIAKSLSLAAKNAMAMVMRAGSTASGLRVVSDFFSELAKNAIIVANDIHSYAVGISQNSVAQWRISSFDSAMVRAVSLNQSSQPLNRAYALCKQENGQRQRVLQQSFNKEWADLIRSLEDLDQQIKASAVIAVNFRLEALSTGQQRELLNHMATEIDALSKQIKGHVSMSLKILRDTRSL